METAVYDFTKSILIDPQVLNYSLAAIVAGLITSSIEMTLKFIFLDKPRSERRDFPILSQLQICNQVWDQFITQVFGKSARTNLEMFGKYLFLRQQRIQEALCVDKAFRNVYKDRTKKIYQHDFFDIFKGHAKPRYHSPNL